MSGGFVEFSMGESEGKIAKKVKRFTAEADRSYRVTLAAFSAYTEDGLPTEDAKIKYAACERIYIKGVGNVLADNPALTEWGKPKQAVATVIVVWPTDKDGDLDAASFKNGKGWTVQPWVFSADKYVVLEASNKKFPFRKSDLAITCTDAGFQKMTFGPEAENLLVKYLESGKPEFIAVGKKILAEARAMMANINNELATKMTPQQVREKLGAAPESPAKGSHAAKDVDDLLNGLE